MKPLHEILFWPVLLAVITAVGLVAALASDEAGDAFGTACLAVVVFFGIRPLLAWLRRRALLRTQIAYATTD